MLPLYAVYTFILFPPNIQSTSQRVLCFSGSLPIALKYLRLIVFFVLFSENKIYDDNELAAAFHLFHVYIPVSPTTNT